MFDLKGKHEHVFLSILNKYIYIFVQAVERKKTRDHCTRIKLFKM